VSLTDLRVYRGGSSRRPLLSGNRTNFCSIGLSRTRRGSQSIADLPIGARCGLIAPKRSSSAHLHRPWRAKVTTMQGEAGHSTRRLGGSADTGIASGRTGACAIGEQPRCSSTRAIRRLCLGGRSWVRKSTWFDDLARVELLFPASWRASKIAAPCYDPATAASPRRGCYLGEGTSEPIIAAHQR
jgi:hypothetical protein